MLGIDLLPFPNNHFPLLDFEIHRLHRVGSLVLAQLGARLVESEVGNDQIQGNFLHRLNGGRFQRRQFRGLIITDHFTGSFEVQKCTDIPDRLLKILTHTLDYDPFVCLLQQQFRAAHHALIHDALHDGRDRR